LCKTWDGCRISASDAIFRARKRNLHAYESGLRPTLASIRAHGRPAGHRVRSRGDGGVDRDTADRARGRPVRSLSESASPGRMGSPRRDQRVRRRFPGGRRAHVPLDPGRARFLSRSRLSRPAAEHSGRGAPRWRAPARSRSLPGGQVDRRQRPRLGPRRGRSRGHCG